MSEHEFIRRMYKHNGCPAEVSQRWIKFAYEIVNEGQFVDFKPKSKETGVQEWLASIYAACYFARQHGGNKTARAIYKTASIHCLYPHEIIGTISYIRKGGDPEQLVKCSLEGILDYDGKLPVLSDVEHDRKKQRDKGHDER